MPMDVQGAISIATHDEFDAWLRAHGTDKREVIVAIYKKASAQQSVTFVALQEAALCHGWVDTQTKSIDDERYAIRFVPRRPRSNWSATNRAMARRMLDVGRLTTEGIAMLPSDL